MDISVVFNEIRSKVYPPLGPEASGEGFNWGHGQVLVAHLMQEDYSAGYYSYIFSKAFAADMFESTFSADLMDREQGQRYRRTVLSKGGSIDEMEILTTFLGRKPDWAAFHRSLSAD
ncbi:unnamed protein product [Zymoseptoria tritici ST99CH_1A5]|nr:unnamed protein product [Zymoseptoria tritici ST99CH_3D1]SMY25184.1 unnamed protein product [Zymoseptoria tritici ST99CH_1A5]